MKAWRRYLRFWGTNVDADIDDELRLHLGMRALLFEVQPADVATLVAISALVGMVALLAAYLPARRATQVDPVEALRAQ